MWPSSPDRARAGLRPLVAIVAAALAVRLLLIFGYGTVNAVERFEYDDLARGLLAGEGWVYRHLGTPYFGFYSGVPYVGITAVLYALVPPGPAAVLVIQSLCSMFLTATVWTIARWVADERAGALAALLVAFHPGLAYYDTHKLHPLSFDALAIAAAVLGLLWMRRSPSAGPTLATGLALGIALLQRGTVVLLIPFAVGWAWWLGGSAARRVARASFPLLGALVIVGPWVVRNYDTFGTLVITTTAAESFWRGNAPHSVGSTYLPSGQTVLDMAPELQWAVRSTDETGQMRLFRDAALADVAADPWRFAARVGRKFLFFWTFAPQFGLRYPRWYTWLYLVYYVPLAAAAVFGAARLARGRGVRPEATAGLVVLGAAMLSVSEVQSLFYVDLRHRWGVEPLLLVLSAVGLLHAVDVVRRRRRAPAAVTV